MESLYVGYDESNHSRYPEVSVAVFSTFESDVRRDSFEKIRSHEKLFQRLTKRDYSFLLLYEEHYLQFKKKTFGKVLSSLLKPKITTSNLEILDIFVDGEWPKEIISYSKDLISDILEMERARVHIKTGARLDKKYPLVNIADELAHYLFRCCTLDQLINNPHKVKFLT